MFSLGKVLVTSYPNLLFDVAGHCRSASSFSPQDGSVSAISEKDKLF